MENKDNNDNFDPTMEEIQPDNVQQVLDDSVHGLLSQVVNLNENFVLHEPTCKICSSPYRNEVEQAYLKNKKYEDAISKFKDLSDDKISKGEAENHMRFHYDKDVKEIQKVEYIDRVKRCSSQNLTTLDRIAICFSIITERLVGVNSITPSTDETVATIEKIKSTETARLMGILNNFLKLQASIMGEMKSSGELISIPYNDFIRVINEGISQAKTPREVELITSVLDKLENVSRKIQ